MGVRHGQAWLLDAHLNRMTESAAGLDLDLPPRGRLVELVEQAVSAWPPEEEGALRLVCPWDGPVFVTIEPVSETARQARRHGVRVITAARPTLGEPALVGVKSLSYAVNLVSLRQARSRGADDALWVSAEGYALEGPTSALVWLAGNTLCTVPVRGTAILPSITAGHLCANAATLGWSAETRMITPDQLTRVDGAWLTSSVRGAVAIRTLDATPLPHNAQTTARIQAFLSH
jgi:4-amino-4-deoxychorismate lyase